MSGSTRAGLDPLLDIAGLTRFLDGLGLGDGPVCAAPIGEGHSNPTFLVDRGQQRWVLRRPPRPPLPPSAHDVLREHRLLAALAGHGPRVPTMIASCADNSVIGAPFYLMEYLDGHVITKVVPGALDNATDRGEIGNQLVDTLAEIHAVDWRSADLGDFGKPDGYLQRQVDRFRTMWGANRTREMPLMDDLGTRLAASIPDRSRATVVHGDYRLGNVMFAPHSPARVIAVFDWELATIGDPLADVGYLLASWIDPGEEAGFFAANTTTLTDAPDRAGLLRRYQQQTGWAIDRIPWYQALAHWKLAVILEASYKRLLAGATDDVWLNGMSDAIPQLAERAQNVLAHDS